MDLARLKIVVAAGLVLSGLFLFRQSHDGLDLALIIGGLIYLYIRWHQYKRSQHQARLK